MKNTKIEWADHTFNPFVGCTKVSPACDHCYAESWAKRAGRDVWGPGKPRQRTSAANWRQPIKWNAEAERTGTRARVFCASLADVFDNAVPPEWRTDLFKLIEATPHLDWLLLTKRVGNVRSMVPLGWLASSLHRRSGVVVHKYGWPSHVWIGATICNQEEADRDIPKLLAVPAAKRFLSIEPMLGPINLERPMPGPDLPQGGGATICQPWYIQNGIDWVIVGGESGPHARPMHPAWARSLRDQCQDAGVAFFFKQHGEWLATDFCDDMADLPSKRIAYVRPDGSFHDGSQGVDFFGGEEETARVGKKAAGRLLDGREWNEVPA